MPSWLAEFVRGIVRYGRAFRRPLAQVALGGLCLLLLGVVYWVVLLKTQAEQVALAEQQARLRARQMADIFALQVDFLVLGVDRAAQVLLQRIEAQPGDVSALRPAMAQTLRQFPEGAIVQIGLADRNGRLVAAVLAGGEQRNLEVNIADRAHFRVHAEGRSRGLYISKPVFGRLSGRWSIQLSRAVRQQGRFAGVLVLSLSPEYISGFFRSVLTEPSDVVMLLDDDGAYLARSSLEKEVMGKSVPAEREFLRDREKQHGTYEVDAPVDGVRRYYAWSRTPDLPLVVSVGLDRQAALAPVLQANRASIEGSLMASGLLLLAGLWIGRLLLQNAASRARLEASMARLQQTAAAVGDGLWEWDVEQGLIHWDARCYALLGHADGAFPVNFSTWKALVHPDDVARCERNVQAALANGENFRLEYRMRAADGSWRWVEVRGQRVREADAQRMVGSLSDISERVAQARLRHALLDQSAAIIFLATPDRRIAFANARAESVFAPPGKTLAGESFTAIHVDMASFERFFAFYRELWENGHIQREFPLRTATGEVRWFDVHGSLLDPENPHAGVIWSMFDIDARHRAEDALALAQRRLMAVIERFPGGVLVEDARDQTVVVVNRAFCQLLHLPCAPEALIGRPHRELDALLPMAGGLDWLKPEMPGADDADPGCDDARAEIGLERPLPDGRIFEIDRVPLIRLEAGRREKLGIFWLIRDISARKRREAMLEREANTDPLTGLPNRRAFLARLEDEFAAIRTGKSLPGALLMLDLDHFKRINDTHGHSVGDEVLVHLAGLLQAGLRRADLAGRLGGEEFAILLPQCDLSSAMIIAERLRQRIAATPAPSSVGPLTFTASLGLTLLEGGLENAEAALARADHALYEAKRNGRNRLETWNPSPVE